MIKASGRNPNNRFFAGKLSWAVVLACAALTLPNLVMAQAGSLDTTFGSGGIVTTANTVAVATAIQSDGKILVAGSAPNSKGIQEPAVARYNTNGSLDSSFGSGGIVVTSENNSGPAFAIAIQSDGKIVVGAPAATLLDVFRYNANGTLDTSFGTSGIASIHPLNFLFGPTPGGVVIQTDGKILVAAGITLARLLTDGVLDSSFGTGGLAPLASGAQTMALLSSGKILVASSFALTTGGVARYNSNGSLDTTFGVAGQTAGLGPASAMVLLASGKLIVAGTLVSALQTPPACDTQGFALVRSNSIGTSDTSFGTRGGVVTPFPGNPFSAALAVQVQSNANLVVAGQTAATCTNGSPGNSDFALARYTPNGPIDTTFGKGGFVSTAIGSSSATVSALAIQSDGKIVAVGNSSGGITLARYLAQ